MNMHDMTTALKHLAEAASYLPAARAVTFNAPIHVGANAIVQVQVGSDDDVRAYAASIEATVETVTFGKDGIEWEWLSCIRHVDAEHVVVYVFGPHRRVARAA